MNQTQLAAYQETHRTGTGLLPVAIESLTSVQYSKLLEKCWMPDMTFALKFLRAREQAALLHSFRLFETVHWKWRGGGLITDFNFPGHLLILWGRDADPPVTVFNEELAEQLQPRVSALSAPVKRIIFTDKDVENSKAMKGFQKWGNKTSMSHWQTKLPKKHQMNTLGLPDMSTDNRNQKEKFGYFREEAAAMEEAINNHIQCSSKSDKLDVREQNAWQGAFVKGKTFFDQNFSAALKSESKITLEHPPPLGKDFVSACKRLTQASKKDFDPETTAFLKLSNRYLAELLSHAHLTINYMFSDLDTSTTFFSLHPDRQKRFEHLRIGQTANILASDRVFAFINDFFKDQSKFKFGKKITEAAFFNVCKELSMMFNITGVSSLKRSDFIKKTPTKFSELHQIYKEMYRTVAAFKMQSNRIQTPADKAPGSLKRKREDETSSSNRFQPTHKTRRQPKPYRGRWENDWTNPKSSNFRRGRGRGRGRGRR